MSFFSAFQEAPEDPILGISTAFNKDSRDRKVNLGVGAYKTEEGLPKVLTAVRKAEGRLLDRELNKEYLPPLGYPDYLETTLKFIYGPNCSALAENRVAIAQAVGGSGALRIAGEMIKQEVSDAIHVPHPTWTPHHLIFARSGLHVETYSYYNPDTHVLEFDAMCQAIKKIPTGHAILFHACCHNPTGVDLTFDQWQEISSLIATKGVLPVFDIAYQGLGEGIKEDAKAIRYFVEQGHELVVCSSYSKNFSLYGERTGAVSFVCPDVGSKERVTSQIKRTTRALQGACAPVHGARIVATVLQAEGLRSEWKEELTNMRERIKEMRKALVSSLMTKTDKTDFTFMSRQHGMFSYSGLTKEQVKRLSEEFAIYMPASGRINIASLNWQNLDYVVDAIVAVT